VQCQRVFLAWNGADLIAFLTLNEVACEWSLDLMRQTDNAPDGTMHLLLAYAIDSARSVGCPRVSLAATSYLGHGNKEFISALRRKLGKTSGADGLRRFKTSFAPNWEPLYAASPTQMSLCTGLWDVLRAINHSPGFQIKPAA